MTIESESYDKKSLKLVSDGGADWSGLARGCVAMATARGGIIDIGIEDNEDEPPAGQKIPEDLLGTVQKRISEITVNVPAYAEIETFPNGGETLRITISRSESFPSTISGHYLMRVADSNKPITGDELLIVMEDRPTYVWETKTNLSVASGSADSNLARDFLEGIRASKRVKDSIKENKSEAEILEHYHLTSKGQLTNLGILCLGTATDRSRLGTAPIVQAVKYDQHGNKVDKWKWDDHSLPPTQLTDAIWKTIPDFQEFKELPDGMRRRNIPAYPERVVRELLVNAIVHRPYTHGGDIFISLHPDRMTITNAGRLPYGVRPSNILHESKRRNENLARIFHDLNLMEREGSGFDMVYEEMLAHGKELPIVEEGDDRVEVTIKREIVSEDSIKFLETVSEKHGLNSRERTCLGIILLYGDIMVLQMADVLNLEDPDNVSVWAGRLLEFGIIVVSKGRKAKEMGYAVNPDLLPGQVSSTANGHGAPASAQLSDRILQDIRDNPDTTNSDIRKRLSISESPRTMQRILKELIDAGSIQAKGENRGRKYRPK